VVRPASGRWIAGVSAGIARRTGLDPLLIRGLFVVVTIIGGAGVLLYGLAWLFLPEEDGRIHAQEVTRGNASAGFVGALLASVIGLSALADTGGWTPAPWGPTWFYPGFLGVPVLTVVLIAVLVWWLLNRTPAVDAPVMSPESVPAPVTVPVPSNSRASDPARASKALTKITLGLSVLGAALVLAWDQLWGNLPGEPVVIVLAVVLGIVSLGVLTAGLLGRRSGGLGPIAILLALVLPLTMAAAHIGGDVHQEVWRPTSTAEASTGVDSGAGELVIDLRDPALLTGRDAADPLRVRAHLGVGCLQVLVPPSTPVVVHATVRVGDLRVDQGLLPEEKTIESSGTTIRRTVSTGTGEPVLVVDASLGLGELLITETMDGAQS
jgi:phage shock protein PspC (stress-responsive transcriptional regulator)